ncbi:MAG: AbrB/MazE/SpoVT family DNA-binding domain-containing protein [Nitrososphaerales archaeon]
MGIVKVQEVGGSTYTVAIPKNVREIVQLKKGETMYVKVDKKRRIIYEPVSLT